MKWYTVGLIRLGLGLAVRSYFSPDEYWQSLEVAHNLVFGYGHLTWEWQDSKLRSIIHPLMFPWIYYLLKITGLDSSWAVAYLPRIFQAGCLWVSDYFLYFGVQKSHGDDIAKKVQWLNLFSWFVSYAGVRTYSNSMELMLTIIAYYYYTHSRYIPWNISIGISCMIRPTAIIPWIPVYLQLLYTSHFRPILQACILGTLCLVVQILCDSLYFSEYTVTAFNFFKFNLYEGKSSFYGTHPWHWYLSDGIPVTLLSYFPMLIIGVYKSYYRDIDLAMFNMIGFTIFFLSLSPHKEYRFLLPVIPFMLIYVAKGYTWFVSKWSNFIKLAILIQCIALAYIGFIHQSAPLTTMDVLRQENPTSVYFWINCHGTPYYSHLHSPIPLDFLHCEP